MLHLYWLEKTQASHPVDCPVGPEKDIKMLMPGRKGHPDKVYSSATDCDTTSAAYRKCTRVPFRKRQAQPALCTAVQVFVPRASRHAIAAAGEAFHWLVSGGKTNDNLYVERHQLYLRTIAKQKVRAKFDLATLPLMSAAARQHSFWVLKRNRRDRYGRLSSVHNTSAPLCVVSAADIVHNGS